MNQKHILLRYCHSLEQNSTIRNRNRKLCTHFVKTLKKNRKRTANERICKLCRLNAIENEYHFLCVWPVYNSRRKILFEEVELKHVHFHTLSLSDKCIFVMKQCQIEVSKFINEAWSIRQTQIINCTG